MSRKSYQYEMRYRNQRLLLVFNLLIRQENERNILKKKREINFYLIFSLEVSKYLYSKKIAFSRSEYDSNQHLKEDLFKNQKT